MPETLPFALFKTEALPPPGAAAMAFTLSERGPEETYGQRAVKGGEAVAPGDLWHWGSTGKPFTASLVAGLVAEGRLAWDAPLLSLIPELAATPYAGVNLRILLAHRSGLPTDASTLALFRYLLFGGDAAKASQRMLRKVLKRKPAFPPGSDFLYSNVGYGLAGLATARALGADFAALMRERLLVPWGLARVGFGLPPQEGSAPREHVPQRNQRGWKTVTHGARAVDDLPLLQPSGCLHGPLAALASFGQQHLKIARGQAGAKAAPLAETQRPVGPPPEEGKTWTYGLGWFTDDLLQNGSKVLWHPGSTGGCFALLVLIPDRASGLVLAANGFDPGWTRPEAPLLHTAAKLASAFGR